MENSGARRRVAIGLVNPCGAGCVRRLVTGFMTVSATLSMWISNTATALLLLPMALAVLDGTEERAELAPPLLLLLGIAFAASIGGVGTPIGTPPNLISRRCSSRPPASPSVLPSGWAGGLGVTQGQ